MVKKYEPINPGFPYFIHGADYNPDQWLHYPDILQEDIRLMKLASCNTMTVNIFGWAALEPQEGEFNFSWLDEVMDRFADNGIYAVLATPSGAKPAWLAQKYPEVLRVGADRKRILHGNRHNHCYTSPVYREKVGIINRKLAERYQGHPALLVWHISNEYSGECHCSLCQEEFRKWLKEKYGTLEKLNQAWWTGFWSHRYSNWSEIESPAPHGEQSIHGLNLDWKRFVTDQTVDFFNNEIIPLREITPDIPVTTNLMGTFPGLNYWKLAEVMDVVSWDSYPRWHNNWQQDWQLASDTAFIHDLNRSLKKGKPFMLMESTPSMTNWVDVAKKKKPGIHLLSSIQAVAHGSDTVQYFQWRKSRGGCEKFHGAVVDHVGDENTRVFQDVTEVGQILKKLDPIIGTTVESEVALLYDWENRWALEDAKGPRREKDYEGTCKRHYRAFWQQGIPVDIINEDCDFSKYKLLIAPMLYMVRKGVGERIEEYVKNGGTLVTTYLSGIVDENDLCFLGGFPGPLRKVLGIWSEEIDALYDNEENQIVLKDNSLNLEGTYWVRELCDLIHVENARILATYNFDFYARRPALTVNKFGQGQAYYIAVRSEDKFLNNFYHALGVELKLKQALPAELPEGVTAQYRTDGSKEYIFLLNFSSASKEVNVRDRQLQDMITGKLESNLINLEPYEVKILTGRGEV